MSEALDENLIVVVQRLTLADAQARGSRRVAVLRMAALGALTAAAQASGAQLGRLEKDERDAPRPSNGWHWSISHTSLGDQGLVAAAVSRSPVGVDVEAIALPSQEVAERTLGPQERRLFEKGDAALTFAQAWTAKEAVLKKLGLGLMAFSKVQIVDAQGERCVVEHEATCHAVESRACEPFIVAVAGRAREGVEWRVDEAAQKAGPP